MVLAVPCRMSHDVSTIVRLARSDAEILACRPVLLELRPHVDADGFLERVRAQEASGYRLAYVDDEDGCVAVAGFRIAVNLSSGRHLYVDDLVTASRARSHGHGSRLVEWLDAHAREHGCDTVQLDSGTQRTHAHRFYLRERFDIAYFHFIKRL